LISRELPVTLVGSVKGKPRAKRERSFDAMGNSFSKAEPVKSKLVLKVAAALIVAAFGAFLFITHGFREETLIDKLTQASATGDIPRLLALLDQGADPGARDREGKTALGRAAFQGHKEMVQLLLARGLDANATGKYGKTALMAASSQGHPEVVKTLLANGAEVNAKDRYNQTALMCAALKGHKDVAKLLLECGADVGVRTKKGFSALSIATERGHSAVVDLILEKKPDLTICDCQSGRSRYY
jgi:ankyrin repeat protein